MTIPIVIAITIAALAFIGFFAFYLVQGQAEVRQRELDWETVAREHKWNLERTGDRRTRVARFTPLEPDVLEWAMTARAGQPVESEAAIHSKQRYHHSTEWQTDRVLNPRDLLMIIAPGAGHDPFLQAGIEDLDSEKAMGLLRGRYRGELGPHADSARLVPGLPKPFAEYFVVLTNDVDAAAKLLDTPTRERLESWHALGFDRESALPVVFLTGSTVRLRIRGVALQKAAHLARLNEVGHALAHRISRMGELQSA